MSHNGPLVFCSLPGRARRCFSDFVVPFARSEVVQGGCDRYYDESWRKREIEIFNVSSVTPLFICFIIFF